MAEPFLGEIRVFSFNNVPTGWMPCNGQLLSINTNQALFSLLGTTFGGNGQTTFALPNLQGRVSVGAGQGYGIMPVAQGQVGGEETHTLTQNEMPAHNHIVNASSSDATAVDPNGLVWAAAAGTYGSSANSQLNPAAVQTAGQSQPHNNLQPYLALSFCIATNGIYPQRP